MTNKTLGYVELEWTCPSCGAKNPGMQKTCLQCGAPQPQNAQFELGDKPNLINDAAKAAAAAKGADIYCPYCNTRNPADAQVCKQCGGDLKEGLRRESGRVIAGQPAGQPANKCPSCGEANPPGSRVCAKCGSPLGATARPAAAPPAKPAAGVLSNIRPWMALPFIALLLAFCCAAGYFFLRTTNQIGTVQATQWQRTIAIEAQRQVTHEDWRDQVPTGAKVLGCEQKYRSRQDNPAPGAKEVCSTRLVDQGNGSAKVEESCYYEVYDDYCQYQALEWQRVDQAQASGSDLQPQWPQVNLSGGEREGQRSESYTVTFQTRDGIKQFTTSDAALYSQMQPGSEWTLSINALGMIMEVTPP